MAYQFSPERAQELAAEAAYHRISHVLSQRSGTCYYIAAHTLLTIGEAKAGLEYGIQARHIKREFMNVSGELVPLYSKKEPALLDIVLTSLGQLRRRVQPSES